MQLNARIHEFRVLTAIRPSYYIFSRLVRFFPVIYVPFLGYIVNDAELARAIMKDAEHFSLNEAGGLGTLISELWGEIPTLLSMEGDAHKTIKYALLDLFTEESLDRITRDLLNQMTKQFVNKLKKGAEVDVSLFVKIFTNRLTSQLLGVSVSDDAQLLRISDLVTKVMGCIDIRRATFTPKNKAKALGFVDELKAIACAYYATKNIKNDTIIGRLKKLGYTKDMSRGFIAMFLIAGTVTVSSTLPRLLAVLIDTDSIEKLKQNPALLNSAIDEGLRYITPGPVLLHGVQADVNLDGHHFKKGRRVMTLLYNIMHDSRYTSQPLRYMPTRTQCAKINNLWFGAGAHFCMGSVLAKREIKAVLKESLKLDGQLVIIRRSYLQLGIYPGYAQLFMKLKKDP